MDASARRAGRRREERVHPKFTTMTPELYEYVVAHCTPRGAVLEALAAETAQLGGVSLMQVAAEQGAFLTLLSRAIGARAAVEVGTFTGYSAVCIARGLAEGGRLLTCDVNEDWAAIARRSFADAAVADRIDLRIGPALDTLRGLPADTTFDLGFIDADKTGYRDYYEEILARLRPGGLLLLDNVLWMGSVVDPTDTSESTRAIRAINDFIARDARVDAVMLPVSDGLTIVRKRQSGEDAGGR
jgi:caffeoyl-CoA O-methyltransferase